MRRTKAPSTALAPNRKDHLRLALPFVANGHRAWHGPRLAARVEDRARGFEVSVHGEVRVGVEGEGDGGVAEGAGGDAVLRDGLAS